MTTGDTIGGATEIVSGLEEGEKVIVQVPSFAGGQSGGDRSGESPTGGQFPVGGQLPSGGQLPVGGQAPTGGGS